MAYLLDNGLGESLTHGDGCNESAAQLPGLTGCLVGQIVVGSVSRYRKVAREENFFRASRACARRLRKKRGEVTGRWCGSKRF